MHPKTRNTKQETKRYGLYSFSFERPEHQFSWSPWLLNIWHTCYRMVGPAWEETRIFFVLTVRKMSWICHLMLPCIWISTIFNTLLVSWRVSYYIPDHRKAKAEISQYVIEAGKLFAEPYRAPWMATTMALLMLCMPRLLDCMKVVPTPSLALDEHPCACSPGNFPVIPRIWICVALSILCEWVVMLFCRLLGNITYFILFLFTNTSVFTGRIYRTYKVDLLILVS